MSKLAYMPLSDYEDACDAIRAKTGESGLIKSGDMAAAIGAIPSGGGGWELIAEAITDEDVEAFRVDIPVAKQKMAAYIVKYDCTFVGGSKYACPRLNSISHGTPYMFQTAHYVKQNGIAYSGTGYKMLVASNGVFPSTATSSVKYVAMVGYYAGDLVAAGSTIKVYGIGEPT